MISKKFLPIFNLIAFIGVLIMNYLANALPLAGRTTGEISDLYPSLFTPSGPTFMIWGLIYLLLLGFIIYQLRFTTKEAPEFLQKISWLFILSCIANMAWLFAWHHLQVGMSMVIMLIILGSLLVIYLRLDIGRGTGKGIERWLVQLPFSVYLGWIAVATIANAIVLLVTSGWNAEPLNPQFWTIAAILVALGLGLWALLIRNDFAFALVITWALLGIYNKRKSDLLTDDQMVEWSAIISLIILAIGFAYFRHFRKR